MTMGNRIDSYADGETISGGILINFRCLPVVKAYPTTFIVRVGHDTFMEWFPASPIYWPDHL